MGHAPIKGRLVHSPWRVLPGIQHGLGRPLRIRSLDQTSQDCVHLHDPSLSGAMFQSGASNLAAWMTSSRQLPQFLFVSSRPKVAAHPGAQVYHVVHVCSSPFIHGLGMVRTDCAAYWCGEITNWLHSPSLLVLQPNRISLTGQAWSSTGHTVRSHCLLQAFSIIFCLHDALPHAAARSSVETFHWPFVAKHQSFEVPSSCASQSDTTALWHTRFSAQNQA